MDRTNRERTKDFVRGLHSEGYLERFLAQEALESAAREVRNPLGNTTHLSVMDADGVSVSVTCSNGSCSGVIVPETGLHLNNMLGEEDLNPKGHRHEPGRARAEHDGADARAARGPARARRRQRGLEPDPVGDPPDDHQRGRSRRGARRRRWTRRGSTTRTAWWRPRPASTRDALDEIERDGWQVVRWQETNLYFGGVQAVARNPETGALSGGGDHRRGGVAVVVD